MSFSYFPTYLVFPIFIFLMAKPPFIFGRDAKPLYFDGSDEGSFPFSLIARRYRLPVARGIHYVSSAYFFIGMTLEYLKHVF